MNKIYVIFLVVILLLGWGIALTGTFNENDTMTIIGFILMISSVIISEINRMMNPNKEGGNDE